MLTCLDIERVGVEPLRLWSFSLGQWNNNSKAPILLFDCDLKGLSLNMHRPNPKA